MLLIIETITWKPHIETAMDIAIQHRDAGTDVAYHNLRSGLPICEDSKSIHRFVDLPSIRIRRAHEILSSQPRIRHHVHRFSHVERRRALKNTRELLHGIVSTEDFLGLKYDRFHDIGWAALSSAVSMHGDSTISYRVQKGMLCRLVTAAIMVYEKTIQILTEVRPDKVLLFNGRFATTRPVLRAAKKKGVPWRIHERGCDKDHYWLYDYLPHDTDARQREIHSYWHPHLSDAAHAFFRGRRNRVERDWHSYTKRQRPGKLPNALSRRQEWVTFFTSSEDEMVAIGDQFRNRAFPTQSDAIRAVAEALTHRPDTGLCIRVHPHVAQKSRADRRYWEQIQIPGALLIGPEDDIDSYALIEHSKVVCTYGSTIGIEATYWGRPSLLLGRSAYDRLGVSYIADDIPAIKHYLTNPVVYPLSNTLPYGAYYHTFGKPHQHYHADTLHRGKILGLYLDDSTIMKAIRALQTFS